MTIPLIDLTAQYHSIQHEIDESIYQVLESGKFILGSEVSIFEKEVANYLGVTHAVGVASGTDALILSLRALEIGIGDEVIVPAYTFFATVTAVLHVGATPVFVDIDESTYCMDISSVSQVITPRTKSIIPVHLFGYPAEMTKLLEMANFHGIKVIEDNAQSFGAEYFGQKTGSFGNASCLSFFPSKNLGAFGDGGMVVTNEWEVAEKVRMLRTHGWQKKYYPELLGYNSRLDTLQAAILRVKLHHVDKWNQQRRILAQKYIDRLESTGIQLPIELPNRKHVYHLFVISHKERNRIQNVLNNAEVASEIYYPQPAYYADPCQKFKYKPGDFPVSNHACKQSFAIPLYPEMTDSQLDFVVGNIKDALRD